jgi:hypothetical protein
LALYGTLTILGGTESGLFAATSTDRRGVLMVAFLLIGGFSACGFWLDYLFMRGKFRVVDATNALYQLALDSTIGKTDVKDEYYSISRFLRISGESYAEDKKVVKGEDFRRTWHSVMWLYLISPLLGIAVIVVFFLWGQ